MPLLADRDVDRCGAIWSSYSHFRGGSSSRITLAYSMNDLFTTPHALTLGNCGPPPPLITFAGVSLCPLQRAVDAVLRLPPSDARDGLVNVCHIVLTRNK